MTHHPQFTRGDVVLHPRRPEWGEGRVDQALTIVHEGQPAQRLVVTFTHYGRTTINTALAPLIAKEGNPPMSTTHTSSNRTFNAASTNAPSSGRGWLADLEGKPRQGELWALPEALTDPFDSVARRLAATLETYRFNNSPRSLLEWAIAQTGLSDPLTKYTRHELEQVFPRFVRDRDNHLFDLVRTLKRQNRQDILQDALRTATLPAARDMLQRALSR